jgi:hypothetical protein
MMEPGAVVAEVSLAQQSSELHRASDAYCDNARRQGWATGETSLGSLAGILTGRSMTDDQYWRRIEADRAAPATVLARVRTDSATAAQGLAGLSAIAVRLMAAAKPSRTDVTDFERALIHARQARESFSDAITELNRRTLGDDDVSAGAELAGFDRALTSARRTADDLAAARMADSVADTPAQPLAPPAPPPGT